MVELQRLAAIRKARDEGRAIWMDPDIQDDGGQEDWTDDWTIEEFEILGAAEVTA
jgi:hypothetical protein